MPRPPRPNAGRAIIGFVLGMIISIVIVGIVRLVVWGIGFYAVPVEIMNNFFAGWFWEDEATLMWAMFGGVMGFVWGSGALYDFSVEAESTRKARTRIPLDPDAPRDLTASPLAPLMEALPSVIFVVAAIVIALVIVGIIPLSGQGVTQTTNAGGDFSRFGKSDFNFLGLYTIENASQAQLFIGFSVIVVVLILMTGAGIALIVFMLNRQVKVAEQLEPPTQTDGDFILIRLGNFFTNWVLDILNGVSTIVRPR
ncbi:MAG TPA: hypothetical protein VJZ27_04645 [Aggregatilineales bacterium]|nr:hypothetical protein [Aggregatilineales bacterium]